MIIKYVSFWHKRKLFWYKNRFPGLPEAIRTVSRPFWTISGQTTKYEEKNNTLNYLERRGTSVWVGWWIWKNRSSDSDSIGERNVDCIYMHNMTLWLYYYMTIWLYICVYHLSYIIYYIIYHMLYIIYYIY